MKRLIVMFVILAAAGTLISDPIAKTDTEVKQIAEPIMGSILSGLEEESYTKYARYFTPQLAQVRSRNRFGTILSNHKKYVGKISDLEFVTELDRKNYSTAVFKGNSSKQGFEILIKLDLIKTEIEVSGLKQERIYVNGLEFEVKNK